MIRPIRAALPIVAAGVLACAVATAQPVFPERAITIVVPQQAGSASDVMVRILAPHLSTSLKQPVVVDNRIGAGGNIGAGFAARSKADGYTLLFNGNSHVINPALYRNAGFDPLKDFVPVAKVSEGNLVVVANAASGAKSIGDLIKLGKEVPGKTFFSSPGNGSLNQLAVVMFEQATGASFVHVPYKGAPASVADVAGGQIPFTFSALASAKPLIASGQLRALAVTNRARLKSLPDVPAVRETVPSFEVTPWYGLFAPAGTPTGVVARLHGAVNEALALPTVQQSFEAQGLTATPTSGNVFVDLVRSETRNWADIVKKSGATVD